MCASCISEDKSVKPHLIIISGPPAAGKSTSARPLATEIGYPLLCMDDTKERLADAIGPNAVAMNDQLGAAAVQQIIDAASEFLAHGTSVVIEGFFQSDLYSSALAELASLANAVLVHMKAADPELKSRYEKRALAEERHWVHGDLEKIGTLKPELPAYMAEPLHLDIPMLTIDTTGEILDIVELSRQLRSVFAMNAAGCTA